MNANPLIKVSATKARAVAANIRYPEPVLQLLHDDPAPLRFLDRLLADPERHPDAVKFLAQALPKREAVWWGCLCVGLGGRELPAKEQAALQAAARWVLQPEEANRQAALAPGKEAGRGTPAGCLALAAFESGGSLLPPGQAVVPPPEKLTGLGVSSAVLLAAARGEMAQAPQRYRLFLALGIGVALGKYPLPGAERPPAAGPRTPRSGPR
jgi:hypothetical protein